MTYFWIIYFTFTKIAFYVEFPHQLCQALSLSLPPNAMPWARLPAEASRFLSHRLKPLTQCHGVSFHSSSPNCNTRRLNNQARALIAHKNTTRGAQFVKHAVRSESWSGKRERIPLPHLIDLDAVVGDVDDFRGRSPVEANHARVLVLKGGRRGTVEHQWRQKTGKISGWAKLSIFTG